ncbi:helix-turn-helix transcriptional regulator [Streptomyces sp. B-S-A8]|uniref:Helix-turn-helix transcriptional regulator n=1 Tax=Streptomyces solicavernae TaxID=3043614 RepID=A0ABT6S067_9ACTN|nr:helix-turn-helix transcriptional regulator [Streptomyces sp. B-S-A8]MDI3390070.1 helix-turn-helix transcriptional regulator [Streptomyces sp. B-S-A8]
MAARRTPNDRLRERLEEAGWNGAELARAVNAAGRQAGVRVSYDRSNVSHWLAGTRPRPSARDLLVRAFAKRLGRLVTVEELGFGAVGTARGDATGAGRVPAYGGASYGDGAYDGAYGNGPHGGAAYGHGAYGGGAYGGGAYGHGAYGNEAHGNGPAMRLVRGGAGGGGTWALPVQTGPRDAADAGSPTGLGAALDRGGADRAWGRAGTARRELAELVLEHRDPRQLKRLRELPYRAPGLPVPGAARPGEHPGGGPRSRTGDPESGTAEEACGTGGGGRAGAVVLGALDLLERSGGRAVRERVVGELARADRAGAARLCRMLGRAWADDLGHGAAQRALELSAALAAEAGLPVLRAAALRDMSVLALELGRTTEALALAEAAVDQGFDGAGAGTRAFLLTQRSVTRAVAGDGSGAVKDMDGAEYWIDRGEDDENGSYSLGALLYQVARMHRAEGDLRRSVSALELSLSLRRPAERRSRALIRIELAHQRLGSGDFAAAADELRMLVPGPESLRSARVDAALAYLRQRALSPDPAPLPRIAYRGRC